MLGSLPDFSACSALWPIMEAQASLPQRSTPMSRRQRDYMRTKAGRRLLAERIMDQGRMVEDLGGGGLFGKAPKCV